MRLSDLLKADAVNEDGTRLGHVHDVRFDAATESAIGWTAATLIVGKLAFAERLGYTRGVVRGPWPLGAVLRWMSRYVREIPWDAIVSVEPGRVVVRGVLDSFDTVSPADGGREEYQR